MIPLSRGFCTVLVLFSEFLKKKLINNIHWIKKKKERKKERKNFTVLHLIYLKEKVALPELPPKVYDNKSFYQRIPEEAFVYRKQICAILLFEYLILSNLWSRFQGCSRVLPG
jgi:hypothetical protein